MRPRRAVALAAAVGVLLASLTTACSSDAKDDYCAAVRDHQEELSDLVGSGAPDALLQAIDVLRDLKARALPDITDEWQQVVGRIEALAAALDEAGVDPATYDREHPPAGLTAAQKARIDAAAAELGSGTTVRALEDLDQQARDVCGTPLTL